MRIWPPAKFIYLWCHSCWHLASIYGPSGLLGRARHCFGNGIGIVITISGEFCVWKLKFAGFCSNFGLSCLANPLEQIWAFSRQSSAFNYLATFLCVLPADGRVPFLQDGKRLCFCRIWCKRRICCIFLCLAWYRFGMHFSSLVNPFIEYTWSAYPLILLYLILLF